MTNKQVNQKLREMAVEASKESHSPYSKVKVGSAVLTTDGEYFSGCNIENSSFGGTICAERVAIFKAVSAGQKSLAKVYVYTEAGWPPCGLCRQVISEFASNDLEIIIGDIDKDIKTMKFSEMLPLAFTPEHLK